MRKTLEVFFPLLVVGALCGCNENMREPSPVVSESVKAASYTVGFLATANYCEAKKLTDEEVMGIQRTARLSRLVLEEGIEDVDVIAAVNQLIDEIDDERVRTVCRGILPSVVIMARQQALIAVEREYGADAKAWAVLGVEAAKEALTGVESACAFVLADRKAQQTVLPGVGH